MKSEMRYFNYIAFFLLFPVMVFSQEPKEYNGDWKSNMRNGQGTMLYHDGSVYKGGWKDNQRSGQGTMVFSKGDSLYGEWFNDQIAGNGTYCYRDGSKYTGTFENNTPHGNGTFYLENGDIYVGEINAGEITGFGVMRFTNSDRYTGDFVKGKMEGNGAMQYATGDFYDGNWENNKREGAGKQTFVNGDFYNGSWKNDKMNGSGLLKKKNGEKYRGDFKNNDYSGKGVLVTAAGDRIQGDFNNGESSGNATIWFANKSIYVGETKKGLPDGKGTIYYPDGKYYKGQVNKGQPDGMGSLYAADGEFIKGGKWKNGQVKKSVEQIRASTQALAAGLESLTKGMANAYNQSQEHNAKLKQNVAASNARTQNALNEYNRQQSLYNAYYQEEKQKSNNSAYPSDEMTIRHKARQRVAAKSNSGGNSSTQTTVANNSSVSNSSNTNIPNYSTINRKQGTNGNGQSQTAPGMPANGTDNNLVKEYYNSGNLRCRYTIIPTGNIHNEVRDGFCEYFHENGAKSSELKYDNGKKLYDIEWNKEGLLSGYRIFSNGNDNINVTMDYHPGSSYVDDFKYVNKEQRITVEIKCSEKGTIKSIYFKSPEEKITTSHDGKEQVASGEYINLKDNYSIKKGSTPYSSYISSSLFGSIYYYNDNRGTEFTGVIRGDGNEESLKCRVVFKDNLYSPEKYKSQIETKYNKCQSHERELKLRLNDIVVKANQLLGAYSNETVGVLTDRYPNDHN